MKDLKELRKWGNEDIEIYYKWLNQYNPNAYTICPVYGNLDKDRYSTFDLIQLKRISSNQYELKKEYVELKGRNDYSINQFEDVLIDLHKLQELQQYGKNNDMEVYIVVIWKLDNVITIHELDLYKDFAKESKLKYMKIQTEGEEIYGWKKVCYLPLKNVRRFKF